MLAVGVQNFLEARESGGMTCGPDNSVGDSVLGYEDSLHIPGEPANGEKWAIDTHRDKASHRVCNTWRRTTHGFYWERNSLHYALLKAL